MGVGPAVGVASGATGAPRALARSTRPKEWPLRFSVAVWSATLTDLPAGAYEFRVRTVDQNGHAQPEPRPYAKSGRNEVQCKTMMKVKEPLNAAIVAQRKFHSVSRVTGLPSGASFSSER